MMTMLVATLGLLPAAMSHAIGSDSQRHLPLSLWGTYDSSHVEHLPFAHFVCLDRKRRGQAAEREVSLDV